MNGISKKLKVISIITILLVLCIGIISNKDKNKAIILDKVNYKDLDKKDMFAIMVYDDDKNDYVKYEDSNTFPSEGYIFNGGLSGCIDNNGNKIDDALIPNADNSITVTTNKTSYCYVYFDIKPYDINVNVTLNGSKSNSPILAYYDKEINCTDGNITYNNKYRGMEFNSISNCNLNYKTPMTTYSTLKSIVETPGTSGTGSIVNEGAAGYRYEGLNPNNYVWFNNELWRIIGSIPIAGDTNNRLVKIIRNELIGGLVYNTSQTDSQISWGNNTLYTLLNTYYYGTSTRTKDATSTSYCYGYETTAKAKCDYTEIGIDRDSYYGQMVVENLLWNIGASNPDDYVNEVYTSEMSITVSGTIGLMSLSDYGYATIAGYGTRKLGEYSNAYYTFGNWLYRQGNEWTSISNSISVGTVIYVNHYAAIDDEGPDVGRAIRPVLYLKNGVRKMSGSGTASDPYIIGM